MSDKSTYTDDGDRPTDPRRGFGDDMGTRVGRPDGAHEAPHTAPHDASTGARPGDPSTNREAVADGLEGSIEDGEGEGQRRVRDATDADVNPDPAAGDERSTFNL